MTNLFRRATSRMDDPGFVRKVSAAGLILVALWFIILTTVYAAQSNDRLQDAEDRAEKIAEDLAEQRDLSQKLSDQIESLRGELAAGRAELRVSTERTNVLSEQIRQLGAQPVVITESPREPEPEPGPRGPQGPPGPSGDERAPPPERPEEPPPRGPPPEPPEEPNVFDPVCSITSVLNLCRA